MKIILQSGNEMLAEKAACIMSSHNIEYVDFLELKEFTKFMLGVPVGSVEFVKEYSKYKGIKLPDDISYPKSLHKFINRPIRVDQFKNVSNDEFIKPYQSIKSFTGNKKKNITNVSAETMVWACPHVPIESEFRFYVKNHEIIGWSRYDDLDLINSQPDLSYVENIINEFNKIDNICSYAIDIGWRSDLLTWDLIEINDGWALGFYNNTDPQSKPPHYQDYADLLVTRWIQLSP